MFTVEKESLPLALSCTVYVTISHSIMPTALKFRHDARDAAGSAISLAKLSCRGNKKKGTSSGNKNEK